ncbi:MAG: uroporphyrinogen-III C-methyltransferase, partial [Proteobacteria bacterium]|nr:uroporphyrinogen-III C-methyltransferase [Pseudomonadota bacterium]
MVYIVGAGPGDKELITVKGVRLLKEADVVIYDRLVGAEILDYINESAERIFVGKSSTYHARPQEEINSLLKEKADAGNVVVRLKGGDPYIFGRGGEEARFLSKAGIAFEVVPGVTAASAVAAYAGIPMTDRSVTPAVTFIAGHRMKGKGLDDLNWEAISKVDHSLVFYMALTNLGAIADKLIKNGMDSETPAAVVKDATMATQKTVVGTLGEIDSLVREAGLNPPAILVIGKVVDFKEALNWFENNRQCGAK